MIRDRAWRRHIEEKVVIRRLRHKCQNEYWWRFEDVNGIQKYKRTVSDYIGTQDYFRAKTISTSKWDSRYKSKYSPNKSTGYHRDIRKRKGSTGLREKDKNQTFKLLKEYGLK